MSKYKKAKILLETKALYKELKPIYATRKLSIGLVSCMLGLTLFAPRVFAQDELVDNSQVQETDQEQGNEDAKNEVNKNKETEKTNDDKKTAGDDKTTETSEEQKVKVPSVEEQDSSNQEVDDILTADEIQEIRTRTNSLENSYFFNGNMVEELKAELRKAKADSSLNYEEAKASLINEAIIKHTPAQKAPGEERAVRNFNIKDADKLEAGMTEINVRGLGMKTGQIIEVLVNGEVKGTFTQPKTVKPSVKITISEALKEGEKVKAILKGSDGVQIAKTEEATAKKKEPKKVEKYKDKLKMPSGEIWIADIASNMVDDFEKADALKLLKDANPDIANDIKSVDFKIENVEGTKTAAYIVTYTDDSTTEKIGAPELQIKKITEKSQVPTIKETFIADGQITITLSKNVAPGSKIGIVKQFTNGDDKNFCSQGDDTCSTGSCKADKSSPTWVTVKNATNTITHKVSDDFLALGRDFGVIVKEYRKLPSCTRTKPQIKIPNVGVRDPKKLTDEEKKAIDKAIRDANTTTSGKSKLPDWTANNIPAYIEFDKNGNVKIIDPSVVDGVWVDDYTKFVPNRNLDGSIKVSTSDKDKVIPVEKNKLVTNLAPNKPTISYKKETGEITVTPDKADTDAKIITVKYKDPEGKDHEVTITKANGENGKWSAPKDSKVKVNPDTGVVTINDFDIQNKTNVSAKVTDEGGIADNDKDAKTSDNKSVPIKIYPKKPKITINDQDGSVTITPVGRDKDRVAKKMVIGYSPVGNREVNIVTVDIDENGNLTLPEGSDFKLNKDGKSITITNDKIKSNTDIVAQTEDGDATDKLESEQETKQVPDKTAPQPPTVNVEETYGRAYITPPTDPDTKTIKVEYLDPKGIKHTFTVTKNGNSWGIEGDPDSKYVTGSKISIGHDSLKRATEIKATATDEAGNESKPGTDISLPPAPDVKLDEDNGVITVTPPTTIAPLVDGMEITYTPATEGAGETKLVAKKDNAGKWSIENIPEGVAIDKNSGVVTITNDKAKEKSKVIAYSSIATYKKSYEKGEAKVPESKAPEAPTVKVQDNGSVTITPKDKGETTVTVTYKDKDGQDKTATATKGKNGEWTVAGDNGETIDKTNGVITIPNGKTYPGDDIIAKAKKGNKTSNPGQDFAKPAPPTITPDQKSGNVTITPPAKGNLDGMDIEYKTPEGTDRKVRVVKGTDKKWKIEGENPDEVTVTENQGIVTIPKGKAKEKTEVIAKSTLGEKKAPAQKTPDNQHLVPDKTGPQAPKVKVNEKNGEVTITPPTDEDLEKVEVDYSNPNGTSKKATATKDEQGKWTVVGEEGVEVKENGVITIPYEKVKKASDISAKAYDKYGNDSKHNTDTQLPPPPTVTPNKDTGVITVAPPTEPAVDGFEITYTPAKSTEQKTIKVKKGNNSKWIIEGDTPEGVTIGENGLVTFAKGSAKENSKVSAFSKIGELKGLDKPEGSVPDKTAPEAPEVKVQDDGSVTITPKKDSDTKTVTVTYKNQDGEDKTATATKGDNGEWTVTGDNGETIDKKSGVITIPKGKSNPGDKVVAKAKDPSENESGPSDDTTMPAPPTITPDQTSGNVTITPPTKGNLDGMDIEYKTPEGTDRKVRVVKGTDKKWKIEGENPDEVTVTENQGIVTIPKGKAKEKTEVKADSTLGKKKVPAEKTPENQNLVPDKTAPNPPEVKVDENTGNVTITPPKDEDTTSVTVTYKKADNTEIQVKSKKVKNKWTLTKVDGTSPVDNGEGVDENSGVITLAKGKYKTGEIVKAYGNDDVNNKSSEDNKTPVEVTIDVNGGTKTIDGSILAKGGFYVLPAIFAPEYYPLNKEFVGWQVGSETKKAGESIQLNANTTVKAIWKDIEYKVTFNGTEGKGSMPEKQVKKGNEYELPANGFTAPEGKEFDGWMIGTEKKAVGAKIKVNANTEVKAIWKDIEYKVTFNGTEGKGSMPEKQVKKGNEYELPANGFTAPEGKKFDGWMVGTEKKAVGAKITVNSDTEVKAVWKDIEYKVTFNGNTGTCSMTGATVKKGGKYKLPENKFQAPTNKEFKTWEVDGKEVAVGTEITVDKDTEVKAVWKDIEYKVSFNGNTGTGSMTESTVKKGEKYKLPGNKFQAPTNKEFKTWEVDGKEVAAGTEITVDKDTEVKAVWKDIEYKVSFNGNSGTGSMTEATVKKGEKYKLPGNKFQAPTNKEFKTWEVDGKEVAAGTEITVDKDTEVKAVWKDIEYKVTFNGNTGTGSMKESTVKKGEKYKLPGNIFQAPTNKEFKTWEVDGKEVAAGTEITVDKDTEVKAVWKDIEYKVSFNGNSGTGSMTEATVKKGEKYKLPGNKFQAPTNKEFKTWEVDGKEVAVGTEITVDKDIEVKAVWKDKKPDNPPAPQPNPGQPGGSGTSPSPTPQPGEVGTNPGTDNPGKPGETPNKPGEKPEQAGKAGDKPEKPGKASEERPSKENPSPEKEKEGKKQEAEPSEKIPVPQEKENKEQAENKAKNTNPNVKTGVESLNLVTASLVSAASALFMTFKKKKND